MIRRNQKQINALNILSDFLLILLSYFLTLTLRFDVLNGTLSLPMRSLEFVGVAALYSAVNVVVYYMAGLYGSYRFKKLGQENLLILAINAACTLVLIAVLFAARIMDYSRLALVLFWGLSCLMVIVKRAVVRGLLRHFRALGYNQRHVVVVGNGHLAQQYIHDIRKNAHTGVTVDGYISAVEKPEMGRCFGRYEDMEEILEAFDFDEVVVALEPHEARFMKNVLLAAEKEGIRVSLIPFYNDYFPARPTIEAVGRSKLINLRATPMDNLGWAMLKRSMDIVVSALALTLLSPVMLFAAVGVRLSSPGPILFRQERVGRDKKPFQMLKFRSMRIDVDHTGWSVADDPRKTKFGSFIRKYSIDELPQLINVLRGDMSLVGPRPELPKYVRQFKEEVPLYLVRQQVRPGMTGWAQVHGLRGDTSIEERVEYDIWYIENWSFWLDIRILFRTAFGGFINKEETGRKQKEEVAAGENK